MNKRHLAVAVIAALALSSSTIASAEGGSHRKIGLHKHMSSVPAIALGNRQGVLTIDTSTVVPHFLFDTTTVTPHIDFETSTATPHFDFETSTATTHFADKPGISDDSVGEDDSLPAGNTFPPFGLSNPSNPAIPPVVPSTPPTAPSWITKPHAKSNDDNRNHSEQSSEDSQD
jgi:hypothetical protein